jgi:prepilin-type N-terminal cleavage/methylation domain-containing protein
MLKKIQKIKDRKGFTIIEVLIVLAIAGLIMLVVFLAVPALNRNSHNNQYKTEANNILSAYQEVSSNNGGAVLTDTSSASILSSANTKSITTLSITTGTSKQDPAIGESVIITSTKCGAAGSNTDDGLAPVAGTSRQVSIIYQIEAASGKQFECVSS